MALSLAKAGPLKPEIKLAQALSEFEAVLPDAQKTKLRTYRGQAPPDPTDVMRFTAEIDRDASRNRKSRKCVGTRLTNVLHAVQQFSTVVDFVVGSSQSQIAGALWATVKISLQLASAISSYFDQLSTLFMRIGLTCPRYQDFGLLYPESTRLQSALCEYFVVIVRLCKQAVLFLRKPFWSQLSSSILNPFESEFGNFQHDLENLSNAIREEVSLASNQEQQNEAKEMSRFRAFAKNFSEISARDMEEARAWKRKKAELQFLNACSVYNHEKAWKQARKRGNTSWIFNDEGYRQWKTQKASSTLWCTGILGSGKTVLSANVVEDLKITTPEAVAYFYCRHDEAKSLKTRTIVGSIAKQIFDHIKRDIVDTIAEIGPGRPDAELDTDQILDYLQELLPSNSHKYFIIIDGLDECEEKETKLLLQCLKQLLMSKHIFQVYCSSRPDVFHWAHTLLEPQWNISMSQTNACIEEYVEDTLVKRLESGSLSVGDSTIILTIQHALLENAHGMFLWVVFQIDSICFQKTDEAILSALEDLPKDLPDTYNRILRKLQQSNAADSRLCRKIFDLVAAAQRPLTLEELNEAVSVKPGETSWDTSKLVNDMLRSLLDSCGSLVAVDEEHLTVHFAHHSVKQHLLSTPKDSDMRVYHINMNDADLYLGDIIVTYLNFGIFDRQLAKAKPPPILPQGINYPSAILSGSLPRSNMANRWAVRLLKSRGSSRLDIQSQLKTAAGIVDGSKEQTQPAHPFLFYAQEYWLFHTKAFKPASVAGYTLWQRLIDREVKTIKLPWSPTRQWHDFSDVYVQWITRNEHWALIDRSLVKFAERPSHFTAIELLLEFLEEKTTDMNAQYINFGAALLVASYFNHNAVVLLSLGKGANVNAEGGYYGTALQAASYNGHEDTARLLLENGANVNAESGHYGTALHAASDNGHEEVARLLLENGADVNIKGGPLGTALQAALSSGHEMVAKLLLEHGADVNVEHEDHGNALQAASNHGFEGIARFLLQNGADVNATVHGDHDTALQKASKDRYEELARLLLENGANVNAEGGTYGTALQAASENGHEEMARMLLEYGADVNLIGGNNHDTALQIASNGGYKEIARLLLEHGAVVNIKCGKNGTALQVASREGYEEIAKLLLEHGADVNVQGGEYDTALQAASKNGHEEIVKLLLKNGANVNANGGYHGTALQAASAIERPEMAGLLLKKGEDISNAKNASSYLGHENIARLLLENGANVNAEGGFHGTALQAASAVGRKEIVKLLLKNGAVATNKTMEAATDSRNGEVKKLIRNALKSQAKDVMSFEWRR